MMQVQTDNSVPTDRLVEQATLAYRAGKFGEAETLCRGILQGQPDHVASLQILAAVAGHVGVPRRGIELLQMVIDLQPGRADGHIQLAKLLRLEGRVSEAVDALKTAIELEPDGAAAHNDLGLIHLAGTDLAEAILCFDRAIELGPEFAIAHFNKGLALERQGLCEHAIEAFRRATAIAPDFAEAHAKIGSLSLFYDKRAQALASFSRAAQSDSVIGAMCEAKLHMEQGDPAAAEAPARRAIERHQQNSDAHCLLGTILMELGRFDEAAAAFDLGIALNRRQIAAYYELVHVKKMREADRPLIAQMEWMLKEYGLADAERADLHLALGKAYDDLHDYVQAIGHFDQGNRLKHRADGSFEAAEHAAKIDRIIETFNAEFLSRNAALGSDWDAPILIVGMPRSGTTLVEQILSSHPEVAPGGELAFWSEQAASFTMNRHGMVNPAWVIDAARDYRALLTGICRTARRVTDKRPQNFYFIALAHLVFPRARIIHCRRHPVDTCLSIYFQNFARKIEFAYDRSDILSCYRQYLRLMAHWRSTLPAGAFLEIDYEQLVADREPLTRKMIAFCGLDWHESCLHSERNRRPVQTASVWQARQPVYRTSVARWQRYEPWLGELRELLSPE
jgi:tetratricopeptide (TPR) repeat protein